MRQSPTSPYTPDLEQLRTWLERMVAALKFVELILGVVNLIARLRDINLKLTKRLAYLTRKRPRSETLERLERQLVLPSRSFLRSLRRKLPTRAHDSRKFVAAARAPAAEVAFPLTWSASKFSTP